MSVIDSVCNALKKCLSLLMRAQNNTFSGHSTGKSRGYPWNFNTHFLRQ